MMLPSDMALLDPGMANQVKAYAEDPAAFAADFAVVFVKLLENGVPFAAGSPVYRFKTAA